jgi:hypothetical protein
MAPDDALSRVELVIHEEREVAAALSGGPESVRDADQLVAVRGRAGVVHGEERGDLHAVRGGQNVGIGVGAGTDVVGRGEGRADEAGAGELTPCGMSDVAVS